jgi:hypothetical protein
MSYVGSELSQPQIDHFEEWKKQKWERQKNYIRR